MHVRVFLSRYRGYLTCPDCNGTRLRREARDVRVGGKTIDRVSALTVSQARTFFSDLALGEQDAAIAGKVLAEITRRLQFLADVGLDYLTLDRLSSTLSGGESQRINLATLARLGARRTRSTCSTSRRSACTRATTSGSSRSSGSFATRGTPWSSSSTTPT